MDTAETLRYFMDEISSPYPDGRNPFPRTRENDEFDERMIQKYGLITKEKEHSSME